METIVIADTDVVIDFFSGIEPVASTVADLIYKGGMALTSVTVFELYAGITGKKRLKQIVDLVSIMPVFPLEKRDAETAAQLYTDLRKSGNLIGNQDILIAGICINNNIPLFTRNIEHFSRISLLKLFSLK
ncbi:MAG: type II toxin-antitoxin system VapC family toxin [Thermodesulfobacteriota bacterium]|nr:type II toxin-antitoxin system VapC family toxin [Thermodesulfobacteriota bacterium]